MSASLADLQEPRARPSPSATYLRATRVEFVRGEGARLWDDEGNEYLDFLAGISVNSVGHCHPRGRRGGPRAGRAPHPRRQPLLHRAGAAPGAAPGRVVAGRQGALLQLRHRGQRGGDQGRAQGPAAGHHRLRPPRLPRAHLRRAVGHAAGVQAGAVRAARARLRGGRADGGGHYGGRRRAAPPRSCSSRSRARAASTSSARTSCAPRARRATRTAPRSSSTRSSAAWGGPARCGPTSRPASCPTR